MSSIKTLLHFLFPKELNILKVNKNGINGLTVIAEKQHNIEVCYRCAQPSKRIHDYRKVTIKDEPIRGKQVTLIIRKRRLWCKTCEKPFTEPIHKVGKRNRTTYNFRAGVCWAAENFSNLSSVRRQYRCSNSTLYRYVYSHYKEKIGDKLNYDLPTSIGIDEHSIRKIKYSPVDYATVFVDHKNKRVYDICDGRNLEDLEAVAQQRFKGFEKVKTVTIDMSPSYFSFAKKYFPNANVVIDRFHVQRLINRIVNKLRLRLREDQRKDPIRHLTLRNGVDLEKHEIKALKTFLNQKENHQLALAYEVKESMRNFFNVKGYTRAKGILKEILDKCGLSKVPLLESFRETILKWKEQILNFHKFNRISNGRVEGFNRKAKLIQRRAYGYKNFENYRMAYLYACL